MFWKLPPQLANVFEIYNFVADLDCLQNSIRSVFCHVHHSIFCDILKDTSKLHLLRKTNKYQDLNINLRQQYNDVKLISPSISTLSIISSLSIAFIEMLKEMKVENIHQDYILKKISAITIRSTYFIFCRRGKDWNTQELLTC